MDKTYIKCSNCDGGGLLNVVWEDNKIKSHDPCDVCGCQGGWYVEDKFSDMERMINIELTDKEKEKLKEEWAEFQLTVSPLFKKNLDNIPEVSMNELQNVLREDVAHPEESLTQESALSNAARTHKGLFVVSKLVN